MSGIVVPFHNIKDEERRNLILRLRYGPLGPPNRGSPDSALRIEGQAVIHRHRRHPASNLNPDFPGNNTNENDLMESGVTRSCIVVPDCQVDVKAVGVGNLKWRASLYKKSSIKQTTQVENFTAEGKGESPATQNKAIENIRKQSKSILTSVSSGDIGEDTNDDSSAKTLNVVDVTKFNSGRRSGRKEGGEIRKLWSSSDDESIFPIVTSPARRSLGDVREQVERTSRVKSGRRKNHRGSLRRSSSLHSSDEQRHSAGRTPQKPGRRRRSRTKQTINEETSEYGESPITKQPDEVEVCTIRKFYEMPQSKPNNVCFDYPGFDLTYVDVQKAIERVIPDAFQRNKVVSMQFENINVKLGNGNKENRWHIELRDVATRNKLIKSGLEIRLPRRERRAIHQLSIPTSKKTGVASTVTAMSNAAGKRQVEVKLYDAVIMEEYKAFLRKTAAAEKLQSVILLCAGRGQSLLSALL